MLETTTITQEVTIPAKPVQVYDALINPLKHAVFTGAKATGEPVEGGSFSAWDGYIFGTYVKLQRARQILAEWKTTEWPDGYPPSQLQLSFQDSDAGTLVTMVHSDVPVSQAKAYREGWTAYYWTPLKEYFSAPRN
jgi:activator of HSP90 ATPase